MTIINALPFNFVNGTTADATQVDANFNEVVNDVNSNGAHNGVNNDITALTALSTPITPVQGGSAVYYGAGGGTANVQTVPTPSPSGFALMAGLSIYWLPSAANTGAMTLNVGGTGAKAVTTLSGGGVQPTIGGEVISGQLAKATYDGTQFVLELDPMAGFGLARSLASATTTDLGTALSHIVNVSGTVTITSFGSSASIERPLYKVSFSGVLILTHNPAVLSLPGGANITTAAGDSADALYIGSGVWLVLAYNKINGAAVSTAVPTIQRFASGSGATYTTPANCRWIRIKLLGGGGGGGGANNSVAGTAGNGSTFSGGTLAAGGGAGASATTVSGGAGGTASGGNVVNAAGGAGQASVGLTGSTAGGQGGGSYLGGNGGGGLGNQGGLAGGTNTGGGGGGGGANGAVASGGGGGAGGYVEHIITSPAATYTYTVGGTAAGASGTTGGAGGAGAAGLLVVEEYY